MVRKITKFYWVIILCLLSVNLFLINAFAQNELNEYYFNRNTDNKISLTFDDGPHPLYTPKILDILDKYNIKATFFIIGENAGYYQDTLREIAKRGHEIGNHTFSHTVIKNKSASDIINEIEECRSAIYEICGENTVLFRPPGGIMADLDPQDAEMFDSYEIILWSIDTMDWAHHSPEEISEYVLNGTKSGDIILMHDYIGIDSPTPKALEIIIPELLERGYEFVTVSELISE